MNTADEASATNTRVNPASRAVRTGPGRVTSACRAKIKLEDAARNFADRASSSEAEGHIDGNANVLT